MGTIWIKMIFLFLYFGFISASRIGNTPAADINITNITNVTNVSLNTDEPPTTDSEIMNTNKMSASTTSIFTDDPPSTTSMVTDDPPSTTSMVTDDPPSTTSIFTDDPSSIAIASMFTDDPPSTTSIFTDDPPSTASMFTDDPLSMTSTDEPNMNECVYKCNNQTVCVKMSDLCDGNLLCDDLSDEWVSFCGYETYLNVTCPTGVTILLFQLPYAGVECWGKGRNVLKDKQRIFSQWCSSGSLSTCDNGTKCFHKFLDECNGIPKCSDNKDEKRVLRNSTCECDQFPCGNGLCVNQTLTCDGINHCTDGSDESMDAGCLNPDAFPCDADILKLSLNTFSCTNGLCIDNIYRCDGEDNCGDNSDETEAACEDFNCGPGLFQCYSTALTQCILEPYKCDGHNDCDDGSDEINCPSQGSCDTNEFFQCHLGGKCIPLRNVCDRETDCLDGSDEYNCDTDYDRDGCARGYLQCSTSKKCYVADYKCDGDDDCDDGSDEMNCPSVGLGLDGVANGGVIGIVIGLIFWAFLIIVVSVVIVFLRRRRYRRQYQRWVSRVPAMSHDMNHPMNPPMRMTQPVQPPAYSEVTQMEKPPAYSEMVGQGAASM